MCRSCRHPLSKADAEHNLYEEGVSCHHCYESLTEAQILSNRDRHKQIMLAKERNIKHLGYQESKYNRDVNEMDTNK